MRLEPIRVLQVVTIMNRAGLESFLMNLYRHIDRTRVQFDFLVHRSEKGAFEEEITAMGGRIYRVPPFSPRCILQNLAATKRFFAEHPTYSIVHSHIDALSAFPLRAAKQAGVPVRIAHSHNTSFDRDLKLPFRLLAKQFLPMYATQLFACSKAAGRFMFGEKAVKTEKFRVLPNAIDAQRFALQPAVRENMRQLLGVEKRFVIGHVGRFSPQKNHEFLLAIFAELYKKEKSAVLLLVGTGEGEQKIREQAAELGLTDAVRFWGVRADIPELMQAMDVFLLPSRYEGLPVVSVEAQAAGLRCFLSSVITEEVKLTNNIKFLSLEQPVCEWADEILSVKGYTRQNTCQAVQQAGYEINELAKKMQEFYEKIG